MAALCLRLVFSMTMAGLLAGPAAAFAQSPAPTLADAIQDLKSGDSFRALLTLNDVIARHAGPSGDPAIVARAHALRAMAYLAQAQPERAQAAVTLALKADAAFAPSPDEVNAETIALFTAARGPRAVNPEADGQTAEQAGNYQQAFLSYLTAYHALPSPPARADDQRLRERIIRVVQRLPTPPVIPADAQELARKAQQLIEAETILGGAAGASSISAASELTMAVRMAPWWPEATFQLATVQQRLSRVDDALMNLALYKLADPQGYAAAAAKTSAAPARATLPAARAVPEGFGTVHIYRRYNYIASSARAKVDCDGMRMAELQNRRIVTFKVPTGPHVVTVGNDAFTIEVTAGGEYYFKTNPGGFSAWSTRPVPADEARAEIKEHNPKPNEPKRVTSTECRVGAAPPAKR